MKNKNIKDKIEKPYSCGQQYNDREEWEWARWNVVLNCSKQALPLFNISINIVFIS